MDFPWIKASLNTRRTEAAKIQADWSQSSHEPSEDEIKRAARLAWEGALTSVEYMRIQNLSITDIRRDQMEKLASIVTVGVIIHKMTHTDQLRSILASVKCTQLWLITMDLSEAETWALVTAMRDGVERVWLWDDVTLYLYLFTEYDGQGLCSWLQVWGDTRDSYMERLRRWTADMGWTVTREDTDHMASLLMERK